MVHILNVSRHLLVFPKNAAGFHFALANACPTTNN
jgi:hypothetical protein